MRHIIKAAAKPCVKAKKVLYNKEYLPYNRSMKHLTLLVLLSLAGCGDSPRTPITKAAAYGTPAELQVLLKHATAGQIQSALIAAARFGNHAAIPFLASAGADLNLPAGVNGWPPLMHAIHKNQAGSAEALIKTGANVNHTQSDGETALMMAAGYGYLDIVRILLRNGADSAMKNAAGNTALDFAVTGVTDVDRFTYGRCQADTVKILLEKIAGNSAVAHAISKAGSCPEVKVLLLQAASRG